MAVLCNKALLFLQLLSYTSTFLLDNQCMAPTPCTCSSISIRCNGKQLSVVPAFKTSYHHTSSVYVNLYSNQITTIPANAFLNISTVNATYISFDLYRNKISSIASNAFKGVENTTKYLNLNDNNLTSIPSSIGQLTALSTLFIQGNPLHSIHSTAFANVGHSLANLYIDFDHFRTWPAQINILRNLQYLSIDKLPFTSIGEHAFRGFEATLKILTISDSKLTKIPIAICHLTHLREFHFEQNTDLNEPLLQPCKMPLVYYLNLVNNNLTEFPQLLSQYPSLTNMAISNNQIRLVRAENIPYTSRITHLYMHNNRLRRIPNAISHLKALSTLDISSNNIESVDDNDLTGLKSLTELTLSYNSLSYISPHAFSQNTQLHYINLMNTTLGYVPAAVMSLPKLRSLFIDGKPIKCTCNMAYLKPWNVTSIYWTTPCESSNETIKDYILHSLPQCP